MKYLTTITMILIIFILSGCIPFPIYKSGDSDISEIKKTQLGVASYYADAFQGKLTANGERFDMYKLTGAHLKLPFNTKVRVTNLKNGQQVVVRINDRGPYKKGRIIDLSFAAAREIDMVNSGTARVKVEVIGLPK